MSRKWHRGKRKNNHHIIPKSRGGTKTVENLIKLDENRHEAFHFLFGTRTFVEAAKILLRANRMKGRCPTIVNTDIPNQMEW